MGTTANYGWTTPSGQVGVAPDVVGDMQNLADDIDDTLHHLFEADPPNPWTPSIDGLAGTTETQGGYRLVGGYCIAHGFIRTKDGDYPASSANLLNLPVPSVQLAGTPFAIGTVEYTRRSDFNVRFGKVMQNGVATTNSKALLYVDIVQDNRISQALAGTGQPHNIGASDALFFNFRLLYRHA